MKTKDETMEAYLKAQAEKAEKRKKINKRILTFGCLPIVGFALLTIVIAIASGGNDAGSSNNNTGDNDSTKIAEIENKIQYLSDHLWNANSVLAQYSENEIKADNMFKEKLVTVTGTIEDIGKDVLGSPYVTLGNFQYSKVQCSFDRSKTDELANLSKGQMVVIQGLCQGKLMNVLLDDCKLEESIEQLNERLNVLKSKK